ncbi:MAG: Ryanodine receptor Ryr [Muribaculaceae bacterium]|nr:Ryanodine receptor Ryr [Muribaculaceae bacterium]
MKDRYIPKPADLADIELPAELACLSETIAKNVHEVWAQNRMAEGWSYGDKRDDLLKQTPCLIPYEELPEIEKDYDRNTAINTLKHIIKLGFEIRPKNKNIISHVSLKK